METVLSNPELLRSKAQSFNFLASLINGNQKPADSKLYGAAFNFLASLINGNVLIVAQFELVAPFNFLASLINGNAPLPHGKNTAVLLTS